ncbi:MAG: SEL1-like repeat protein, partial [Rhizobiaceae bacterium]|nr:SEL1-like repeat protein [Rhizobiaceae bacterium]
SGGKFGEMMKARRKPILMAAAAIMMALAGLQLSKSFFGNDPKVSAAKQAQTATGTKTAAAKPAAEAEVAPVAQTQASAPAATVAPAVAAPMPETADAKPSLPETAAAAPSPAEPEAADMDAAPAAEAMPAVEAAALPATVEAAATAEAPAMAEPATDASSVDAALALPPISDDFGPIALRDAAKAGDPKALFEVGSRYAEGRGVTTDMANAAQFYEKAAELGFAPAQYRIGNFYEKGLGVERDIPKAKTWYQMAASQGNASAMHNLAVLFAMGADGTSDNDSAARWFTEAAEFGVKDSQFNLGILTAKGIGVPQNLEESYKWFALVAKTGDRDAAAKRDEIANALRPEQLERARAATELWRAKPVDPAANSVDVPDAWKSSPETTASIDMDKAVRNIQGLLTKFGYDAGAVDGKMGAKTRQAIAAFQKDNGLPATGEVDEKLVKVLLARK